jgi:CO/xanthine dehydrogenase Mo-binding subunit
MKTRREFIQLTVVGGAAFALGVGPSARAATATFKPNAWIRIDSDSGATVIIGKQEMGQGVRTSLAMIVAEELDLDWSKIRVEQASTGPEYTSLNTGGSGSVYRGWRTLRPAAATAREMLLRAAAKEMNVDRATLRTEKGFVVDAKDRRRSYASLAAVAATLEVPKDVPLKPAKDFRVIGKPTKRIDGPAIVTGTAKYGIDTRVPGMLFATIVRCPVVGGTLKSFDASEAKKVRGVRDVVQIPNAVAVVAENTWAALKGQQRVKAEWDEGPNKAFDSAKYIDSLLAVSESGYVMRKEGDFAAAAGGAVKTVKAQYVYPFYAHAAVEPMNAIAKVTADSCEIWAPTQAPNRVQDFVARHLGLGKEKVKVNPTLIGGGFGRRLAADYAIEAVDVSKAMGGAPVQVVWSRADDMQHGALQHASVETMHGALDAEGNIAAWSHVKISNPIMSVFPPPGQDEMSDLTAFYMDSAWGVYDVPYSIPHIRTSYARVDSPVRYGPWRAVYSPSSVLGRECFFDELAHAAGRDPLQMRLDLLQGEQFVQIGNSMKLDRARLRHVLEVVRDRSQWGKRKGQGVACNIYDGESYLAYVVEVSTKGDRWHVDRVVCAVDCGPVINPTGVEQQVEGGVIWALTQLMTEITVRGGHVEQTSYTDYAVPRLSDAPKVEVHIVPTDGPQPFGMGEPPVPPFAPAVLNALFALTGKRVRRLPVNLV